ncbi:MAG: transcription termination/antitermination protein NusA [Planctomycetes bacterium]|nr:transcription termination/antitermination protein NusA [Planctomycetota bacterium]
MNPETLRILDSIARDRNIERELLIHDLEQAMISAAKKHFNSLDAEEFGCRMDPMSGEITIWRNVQPEEFGGEPQRELIPLETLGRIPAQTAKQVMIQRFREDERSSLLEEFSKRQGDIVTGTAHRYEGGALIVQIDRAEGFMPRSEQIPGEQFHPGDRVRCLILDVREGGSQVKIVLSRSHPDFIRRLFEAEVPEVAERVIEIKAMAREAGFRTKIAVSSIDSKVDAVGACVGVRGSRIRNIVDELGGEKIDIVRWNESSQILIANALKPAEVEDVSLCFELGRGTVIVREDQLSLAIGRRGQNVRLAARLTGWDLDILTPAEFGKSLETLEQTVRPLEGVTEEMLDRMGALGMISVFDVEEVGAAVLEQELGMSEELAGLVVVTCASQAKIVAEQQQAEKEEAERRRAEEEAAGAALLGGAGSASDSPAEPDATAEAAAASILGGGSATPAPAPAPEPAVEETPAPEPAVEETSAPEPGVEETSAPEPAVEETSAPEADAEPETNDEDGASSEGEAAPAAIPVTREDSASA